MNQYNTAELSRKIDSLERRLDASLDRERKMHTILLEFAKTITPESKDWTMVDAIMDCDPDA